MASPVVAGTAESSTNTAGTSHVLNWTGLGTVSAGDLLIIILDKGSTAATINSHADWTELLDENQANGLYIAYRWATGGETAPTLTSSASTRSAEITYRITGAADPAVTPPAIGTTASGSSTTPDPPSVTPPSSKDYLFIAFYGAAGEEADDDTWSDTPPANYTPSPPRQKACGIAGTNLGGMIAAAERALTTGSAENPGTFAKDVSAAWRAQTIIIHPPPPTFSDGDSVSFTEGFTKQVGLPEAESISWTETFTKMSQIVRGDTVSFTEGFSAILLKTSDIADTLGFSETFTAIKNANSAVGDAVALTETFVKSVAKTTSDTLGLTEGFTAVRTFVSTLGETLTPTEFLSAIKNANSVVGDGVVFTETFLKSVAKTASDTLGLTEGVTTVKTAFRELGDTLGITEIFTKGVQKQQAEALGMTENLQSQVGGGPPPASEVFSRVSVAIRVGIG